MGVAAVKKPASMNFNFNCDDVASTFSRRLNTALARTYWTAKLLLCKTTCSITLSKIDKYLFHVTASCFYKFTCAC